MDKFFLERTVMFSNQYSTFILPITDEDVKKSQMRYEEFSAKKTLVESLWLHPTISSFLMDKNPKAVSFLNMLRAKQSEDLHVKVVAYHLVKQANLILGFLREEMRYVLTGKILASPNLEDYQDLIQVTNSMLRCLDELHVASTVKKNNYFFTKDRHLKSFLQLWLLVCVLAKKEGVSKDLLEEARLELRGLLQNWHA